MTKKTFHSVKELRESYKLSQEKFAKFVGVRQGTISDIENGKNVSKKFLEKIAEKCDCVLEIKFRRGDVEASRLCLMSNNAQR